VRENTMKIYDKNYNEKVILEIK